MSRLGQTPTESSDKLVMCTHLHKAAYGCRELDLDLRAVSGYSDWQENVGWDLDAGQSRLPSNLRGLLQHLRNIWEHRDSWAVPLGCAPHTLPSMGIVIGHFERSFPDIIKDAWQVARKSEAGRAVLRCGFPELAPSRKRRREDSVGDTMVRGKDVIEIVPTAFIVAGAVWDAERLNGNWKMDGYYNGKPKYKNSAGGSMQIYMI